MPTTEDLTNLSPEQIDEILSAFFDDTRQRQYIGARYIPVLGRKGEDTIEWDNGASYEPLTIVVNEGNSYTSRCYVPTGAEITDTKYWARTANFNAQVEQYRQETMHAVEVAEDAMDLAEDAVDLARTNVRSFDTVTDMQAASDLAAGMTCHTNGFHASGDGGAAYYTISTSGTADGTNVIACGTLYAHRVESPYITPDMFNGTDTEKLQACFDALDGVGGNIILNRDYSVDSIVIKNDSDNNIRINIIGAGQHNRLNMTGSFIGKTDYNNNGNVSFQNISFNTSDSTLNAFDCDRLIRLYFDNCVFTNFNDVFHNDTHVMQTMYFTNCMFRSIGGMVVNSATEVYDIRFSKCLVEASNNFMNVHHGNGINILDSCIEGLRGYVLTADSRVFNLNVCFNYFEANAQYFILSNAWVRNGNISSNQFGENKSITLINLPNDFSGLYSRMQIENNVLKDNTAPTKMIGFATLPSDGSKLKNLFVKNNRGSDTGLYANGMGLMPLREFEIYGGVNYDCVVVFGSDGGNSSSINIPIRGTYTLNITEIRVLGGTTRDVSLYSAVIFNACGFSIYTNDTTERSYMANKSAVIKFNLQQA